MPDPITASQTLIANWATAMIALLPIGFAFGAGMVSTVNPCGFAMLPAYLSLYLGTGEQAAVQRSSSLVQASKAVYLGGVVTLGFVVLFGAVGIVIAAGGQLLVRAMPWAGLLTGLALAAMGVFMLAGHHVYAGAAARLSARIGISRAGGPRAFFLFGIGYALASLACTLPVFLVVVGSSLAARGIVAGISQFISYALGMGVVLVALTVGMALLKGAAVGGFRRVLPYVQQTSAVLVLLMGAYLVYYYLTKGGILASFV